MRLLPWILLVSACATTSRAPATNAWTSAGGVVSITAAENAIRAAPTVAIVALDQQGSRCLNSIAASMETRVIEGARGTAPAAAAALDRHTGFGGNDGYLVAAIEPSPANVVIGDFCDGAPSHVDALPATVTAYLAFPDLESARAEAARLVVP